jgi:hypothetical protein
VVQDCDDLVEVQVAARVERMRDVEMAAARQEAAAKYVLERERGVGVHPWEGAGEEGQLPTLIDSNHFHGPPRGGASCLASGMGAFAPVVRTPGSSNKQLMLLAGLACTRCSICTTW